MDASGFRYGPVADSCENDKESLGFVRGSEFLD
jgi:hypothetical protein